MTEMPTLEVIRYMLNEIIDAAFAFSPVKGEATKAAILVAFDTLTAERDGLEAALEVAKGMAMSIHLHGNGSEHNAVDIYAVCFNALNPDEETDDTAPTAAVEATP